MVCLHPVHSHWKSTGDRLSQDVNCPEHALNDNGKTQSLKVHVVSYYYFFLLHWGVQKKLLASTEKTGHLPLQHKKKC